MVRVSIVMTVFNREQFLPMAIASFRQQTFSGETELIIWDDGSTDQSAAIAQSVAQHDQRIRFIQADHLGRSQALVKAMAAAAGQYVGLLDSDDLLLPTAIEESVALLENDQSVGMVYSQYLNIDERGNLKGLGKRSLSSYSPSRLLVDFMTFHFRLFRRSVYEQVGGFDPAFEWAEDYDLCLKLSEVTTIRHLPKPLYCYRSHADNLTLNQVELVRFSAIAIQNALQRRGLHKTYQLNLNLESSFNIVPVARAAQERRVIAGERRTEELGKQEDTNEKPLVSIIIPCFNAAMRIEACLKSCLDQTYHAIEIIVVDNNSTDDSGLRVKRVGEAAHCPVVLLDCPQQGANHARNMGFEVARGDYIQWLDADDTLDSHKIERQVALLEAHDEVDIAYGDWRWRVLKDGAVRSHFDVTEQQYKDLGLLLLLDHWRPPHAYLLKRAIALQLHNAKAWHPDTKCAMDREYFSLAALFGARFAYVPDSCVSYVHWSNKQVTHLTPPIKRVQMLQNIFSRLQRVAIERTGGKRYQLRTQHWLLLKQSWALWKPAFSLVIDNDGKIAIALHEGKTFIAVGAVGVVAVAFATINKSMTLEAIALAVVKKIMAIALQIENKNDLREIHDLLNSVLDDREKAEALRMNFIKAIYTAKTSTSLRGPQALPMLPLLRFKVWTILNQLQHEGWLMNGD